MDEAIPNVVGLGLKNCAVGSSVEALSLIACFWCGLADLERADVGSSSESSLRNSDSLFATEEVSASDESSTKPCDRA